MQSPRIKGLERSSTVFEAQDNFGGAVEARDKIRGGLVVARKHGRAKIAQLHHRARGRHLEQSKGVQ